MALRDKIKRVMAKRHLNPNYFAEVVDFLPSTGTKGQDESEVTIHIEERQDIEQGQLTDLEDFDEIIVLAFRDPSAVDGTRDVGGIDTTHSQDKIYRRVVNDPDPRPYFFQREVTNRTADTATGKVRLVYRRRKIVSLGAGN